jgi:hypothetical protein
MNLFNYPFFENESNNPLEFDERYATLYDNFSSMQRS